MKAATLFLLLACARCACAQNASPTVMDVGNYKVVLPKSFETWKFHTEEKSGVFHWHMDKLTLGMDFKVQDKGETLESVLKAGHPGCKHPVNVKTIGKHKGLSYIEEGNMVTEVAVNVPGWIPDPNKKEKFTGVFILFFAKPGKQAGLAGFEKEARLVLEKIVISKGK